MRDTGAEANRKTISWKKRTLAVLFWLLLWQIAAVFLRDSLVFVGPLEMLASLLRQIKTGSFWLAVGRSALCIMGGFLAALAAAVPLSCAAFCRPQVKALLEPVVALQKSVPVASFVVLLLIWMGAEYLAAVLVFFMDFPIFYTNLCEGLERADEAMLEMAAVYRMPRKNRVRYLYCPALWPYLISAVKLAAGMSWKSGAAAELIALPAHSIGENLYMAKIYLNTDSLFAWTLVIILLCTVTERVLVRLLEAAGRRIWNERPQKSDCEADSRNKWRGLQSERPQHTGGTEEMQ